MAFFLELCSAGPPSIICENQGVHQYLLWHPLSFSDSKQGLCRWGFVIGCCHSNENFSHGWNSSSSYHWKIRTSKPYDCGSIYMFRFLKFPLLFLSPTLLRLPSVSFYSSSAVLLQSEEGGIHGSHLALPPLMGILGWPLLKFQGRPQAQKV